MFFEKIEPSPIDPIFGLSKTFQEDPREEKINLTIGIYKNEKLEAKMMDAIAASCERVANQENRASYLPMDGDLKFVELIGQLAFSPELYSAYQDKIYGAQTLGGTGALRIGAEFLLRNVSNQVAFSSPTWANHKPIFERAGFTTKSYRYYEPQLNAVSFEETIRSIEYLSPKTVVLLHASCHNPTGADLTQEQWQVLSDVIRKKDLLPFFDCAYQGMGRGLKEDSFALRYFLEKEHEMLVSYTCSKNFSLYCQRVGVLFVIAKDSHAIEKISGQVKNSIRRSYSNPPFFGAEVIVDVLTNEQLRKSWLTELEEMRQRILQIRKKVVEALYKQGSQKDFGFLKDQWGMFSFLGLTTKQVDRLREEFAIYMPQSGRLSMFGLNEQNVDYVAQAIVQVLK